MEANPAAQQIPECRPPVRDTRRAALAIPPGSVDCHTHVFAPGYPLTPNRGYTPPDSTLEQMLEMHSMLGIDRVVFTQPSVYGTDNSAILDAMAKIPDRARAVVAIDSAIDYRGLAELDSLGARGIRLNLDNVGGMPVALDQVPALAARIAEWGWHVEFLFAGHDLPELLPLLRSLPAPVSIGHFGYMPAAEGVGYPPFRALLDLVAEGNTWVKLSAPNRLGVGDLPPWPAVIPLAQALIEANPDRMLWATDWPHPNKFGEQPNDADLIEQLELWAPDEPTRHRILVDNPNALYRF
jgi:predicted TIM-barrel fold metal-dependent hydrolase